MIEPVRLNQSAISRGWRRSQPDASRRAYFRDFVIPLQKPWNYYVNDGDSKGNQKHKHYRADGQKSCRRPACSVAEKIVVRVIAVAIAIAPLDRVWKKVRPARMVHVRHGAKITWKTGCPRNHGPASQWHKPLLTSTRIRVRIIETHYRHCSMQWEGERRAQNVSWSQFLSQRAKLSFADNLSSAISREFLNFFLLIVRAAQPNYYI